MKVLAITDSTAPWHSFWIRIGQYIRHLGIDYRITADPKELAGLGDKDVAIIYRFSLGWVNLCKYISSARSRNVRIICDVDDYLWSANGWSIGRLGGFTNLLKQCDLVTCSTPRLHEQLRVMFPHAEISLVENTAPIESGKRSRKISKIRIGWTGAAWTRPNDLKILSSLVSYVDNQPDRYQLVHVGSSPYHPSLASILNINEDKVENYPLMAHMDYVRLIDFDIGLAPLSNSLFNHYKSPIKVIEYSSAGIPWIASDEEPYRRICDLWEWNGRLCKRPFDWIRHLQELTVETKRESEGSVLRSLCCEKSSFHKGVYEWSSIIRNISTE